MEGAENGVFTRFPLEGSKSSLNEKKAPLCSKGSLEAPQAEAAPSSQAPAPLAAAMQPGKLGKAGSSCVDRPEPHGDRAAI